MFFARILATKRYLISLSLGKERHQVQKNVFKWKIFNYIFVFHYTTKVFPSTLANTTLATLCLDTFSPSARRREEEEEDKVSSIGKT